MNRARKVRYEKLTVLFFGEGGKEKRFFAMVENSTKFRELLPNWSITPDNASGESCEVILTKCISTCNGNKSYDVVLCFIDTDKLKSDYGSNSEVHKERLERKAQECEANIHIIWQEQDHEEELSKAADREITKARLKKLLKTKVVEIKIMNSVFVKRIFSILTRFESDLGEI